MSELKTQFEEAVQLVQTAEGDFKPSNDLKLEMYSLFKQATEGDVKGKRPGMLNMVGRAKYDAWAKLKGTSKEDAMKKYIAKIESLKSQLT
ncbi:MAG TPA: acyl-CoA-binding protein [Myxococcales bacterium]|mgnify:CR=1 FL=1|nr:acyl-CoA-binding protein [Deltaproteobacteria bacterium]MBU51607.1 acyl-CoA-binding protein [Deltaproteobacteria bacterium]HAA56908.1 acyl-CoA-binding protein [Myxococcales bacterium]|tara:strand:- start:9468 stop:9740 length:273 start_codon:yes stop_codon:yes gene_type:complete